LARGFLEIDRWLDLAKRQFIFTRYLSLFRLSDCPNRVVFASKSGAVKETRFPRFYRSVLANAAGLLLLILWLL